MKITDDSVKKLALAVCGDSKFTPYISGLNLVELFNKHGFNDTSENMTPSRCKYAEIKIRELNGKKGLKQLVENIIDPRKFISSAISIENAIEQMNNFLKYDKYELRKVGHFYRVFDFNDTLVTSETIKEINHEFVGEQIQKFQTKIHEGDYSGAITNARTLVEAILIEIIEKHKGMEVENSGKLPILYKQVAKILKLESDKSKMPDTIIQILSGLDSITNGLAGLSNDAADRHANKFRTEKHHAKLSVNCAMTLCDFLIDSLQYQKEIRNKNDIN